MTLPRGFGKGWDEPKEPVPKCKLGKDCEYYKRCSVHEWTRQHDDAYLLIKLTTIVIAAISIFMFSVFTYSNIIDEHAFELFKNMNCKQLAEHIADYGELYREAEHRYEWLCVDEKIQEFGD